MASKQALSDAGRRPRPTTGGIKASRRFHKASFTLKNQGFLCWSCWKDFFAYDLFKIVTIKKQSELVFLY